MAAGPVQRIQRHSGNESFKHCDHKSGLLSQSRENTENKMKHECIYCWDILIYRYCLYIAIYSWDCVCIWDTSNVDRDIDSGVRVREAVIRCVHVTEVPTSIYNRHWSVSSIIDVVKLVVLVSYIKSLTAWII